MPACAPVWAVCEAALCAQMYRRLVDAAEAGARGADAEPPPLIEVSDYPVPPATAGAGEPGGGMSSAPAEPLIMAVATTPVAPVPRADGQPTVAVASAVPTVRGRRIDIEPGTDTAPTLAPAGSGR